MLKLTFVDPRGVRHHFVAREGQTLMEVARDHNAQGIVAECGGACACGTCHVRIAPEWMAVTGAPSDIEASMLEYAQGPTETSRLSCQIVLTADMDGLVVSVPEE